MARYTGPRVRISRRFGIPIFGPTKYLERRNYGPGVHGPKSRRKTTEYGAGLIEKQKLKYYYGLLERQFRGVYEKALRRRGVTGEQMLQILETRLDNVVFHLGFANTRAAARQMVGHGHITVNGREAGIPSYALKVNDVIAVKNHNGLFSPSTCAVIGRAWRSSTPSTPSITVMSDFRAFQSFASSSCGVGIALSSLGCHGNRRRPPRFLVREVPGT